MFYWRLRTGPLEKGGTFVFFKTKNRYIPDMVVDLAVRSGDLHGKFAPLVDEVVEISEQEYFAKMWE